MLASIVGPGFSTCFKLHGVTSSKPLDKHIHVRAPFIFVTPTESLKQLEESIRLTAVHLKFGTLKENVIRGEITFTYM